LVTGGVLTLILATAPWTLVPDLHRPDQIPVLVIICATVFLIAALMFSTAIAMRRQAPFGRKLGLLAAAVLMLIFWPFGVYSWWFLQSDGAKKMYGVESE
jgi:heme/copper-type cytochrome/quinol oxidase subunit 3